MKKGKLVKKENCWWVESEDILYPVSLTSSYLGGRSIEEGKEVNFEIETDVYYGLYEEEPIQWAVLQSEITRVEVINHTSDKHPIGRIFTYYGNVEISMQDGGKTCKVFI